MSADPRGPRAPRKLRSVDVREELAAFAEAMEEKLVANDHKKHWREVHVSYLVGRLREELKELEDAHGRSAADDAKAEAVDVANFAMMIYDWIENVG